MVLHMSSSTIGVWRCCILTDINVERQSFFLVQGPIGLQKNPLHASDRTTILALERRGQSWVQNL
ncbi:hypothetical protein QJS04_geneDACA017994 [Acorus gramineus]|uniref:Uncharacterized protein n=1 Tax=Acorus gramineus TaxID=55184 RepID=A0AAV9A671_ACOGR|nr:hypothetical protein QJS04_geneDACA017994 [Acorus gramineus]